MKPSARTIAEWLALAADRMEGLPVQAGKRHGRMRDTKQSADISVDDTASLLDRAVLALNSLDLVVAAPDGSIVTEQDAQAVRAGTAGLRDVIGRLRARMSASPEDGPEPKMPSE